MGAMTVDEEKMWELREEERVIESVVDFLKDANRFFQAAQVGLLFDRYRDLKSKQERNGSTILQNY